jgi:hyaluronan synthase
VVVSIDSDSVITRGALLAMAGPFQDPKVGAVAGKVKAYNLKQGIIARMLHVRYLLSFDYLRAVQSTYRTVYCCPGALAAYRIGVVKMVLEQWRAQTFLGVPCTYGEDRALTNYILSQGYDSVYQGSAEVYTLLRYPVGWSVLGLLVYRSLENPGTILRVFLANGTPVVTCLRFVPKKVKLTIRFIK